MMTRNGAVKSIINFMATSFETASDTVVFPVQRQYVKRGGIELKFDAFPRIYLWTGDEIVTKVNRFKESELDATIAMMINPADHRDIYPDDNDCIDAALEQMQICLEKFNAPLPRTSYNAEGILESNVGKRCAVNEIGNDVIFITGDPSFVAVEIGIEIKYVTLF